METKTCCKCGQTFPATAEFFHRNRAKRDGLQSECKACVCESRRRYYEQNAEQVRESRRRYYEQHPEKVRESQRLYREQNREQVLESKRLYQEQNREKLREYQRFYYEQNREKRRESTRLYQKQNPEARKASKHRRSARQRALPATYTAAHWRTALTYFEGKCAVCGQPAGLWHTLAADHWVPLSSPDCPGTVPGNIVPLCHGVDGCNNSKNASAPHEWLVRTFGARQAKRIEARIAAFFRVMEEQEGIA